MLTDILSTILAFVVILGGLAYLAYAFIVERKKELSFRDSLLAALNAIANRGNDNESK